MNMTPIVRQLCAADFKKMLAACRGARERFPIEIARLDPSFEYHIDLPQEQGTESREQGTENSATCRLTPETCNLKPSLPSPLSDMPGWLADGKRFPND